MAAGGATSGVWPSALTYSQFSGDTAAVHGLFWEFFVMTVVVMAEVCIKIQKV
jgi:hypothetical protein